MDLGIFLSILSFVLVIPLGVATNVLTPKVLNWYSNYSISTREKRVNFLKSELEENRKLLQNTNKLLALGIISILRILVLTTLSGLIVYLLSIFQGFMRDSYINNIIVFMSSSLLNYSIAILATRDMRTFRRIYKFEEYEEKVQKDIVNLENTISKTV